jgi:hypothetical protein
VNVDWYKLVTWLAVLLAVIGFWTGVFVVMT